MSDESADNTQISDRLAKAEAEIADLKAKTEPLQNVTNALNVVAQLEMDFDGLRQRMDAQDRLCQLLEAKFKQLEQRIAAIEEKTGSWLPEDRYTLYASIASIKARLDAMVGQNQIGLVPKGSAQ